MKKKWLGFNKVLLGFSMAGGFIVSIVAAVVSSKLVEKNEELGFVPFVVFLAGALLVFGFHALWGLLVEAAGNLASLPEEMAKRGVSYSAQRGSAPVSGQTSAPVDGQTSVSADDTNPELSYWECPNCGNNNDLKYSFCRQCGTAKKE